MSAPKATDRLQWQDQVGLIRPLALMKRAWGTKALAQTHTNGQLL
jgi:hypothetical protein